jgi:hypothetical protein
MFTCTCILYKVTEESVQLKHLKDGLVDYTSEFSLAGSSVGQEGKYVFSFHFFLI